jgi:hypothetical protein
MKTKTCSKCGKELPATKEYFYKDKKGKLGLYSKCKECHCKISKNYRDRNKEKYIKYREEHKEEMAEYNKKYWAENKEKLKKDKIEYRKNNREMIRKKNKEYKKNNKDVINRLNQKRRSLKRGLPFKLTTEQWTRIKKHFESKCAYCGEDKKLHQEHFIPLAKNGEFTHNNIIPACKSCNCSKQDKDFFDWYPKQEFYSKEREAKILVFLNYEGQSQQLKLTL